MSSCEPSEPIEPGKLTLIGYWLGPHELDWPDARNSVDSSWDDGERQTVIAHLRKGTRFRSFMGLSMCRFCSSSNGSCEQTDDTYYWPEGLTHYLEKHDVRLPKRFVSQVLRAREVRHQVRRRDLEHAPLDETWWKEQPWGKGRSWSGRARLFLEVLRQEFALAKMFGAAVEIENGVATRMGQSVELLLQAVKEAQREHEAQYGPQAPPIQWGDPEEVRSPRERKS